MSSLNETRTYSQQEGWRTHARVTMASATEIYKLGHGEQTDRASRGDTTRACASGKLAAVTRSRYLARRTLGRASIDGFSNEKLQPAIERERLINQLVTSRGPDLGRLGARKHETVVFAVSLLQSGCSAAFPHITQRASRLLSVPLCWLSTVKCARWMVQTALDR